MSSQMERARAARDFVGRVNPMSAQRHRQLELEAFMAIFEPNHRWHGLPPCERHDL